VSSRGGIKVCDQRVQVGMTHARRIVTVEVDQTVSGSSTPPVAFRTVEEGGSR